MSVDCGQDTMMAKVKTNSLFKGKVYTKDKPLSCFVDVVNTVEFNFPISLTGNDCGTVSEVRICSLSWFSMHVLDEKLTMEVRKYLFAANDFSIIFALVANRNNKRLF